MSDYEKDKYRLRVGEFIIELRRSNNSMVIVTRNDNKDVPHLTISFNNPTGLINIHLTKRVSGEPDQRIDVAKIAEEKVAAALSSLVVELKSRILLNLYKLKKIRPGWLGRRGYIISYLDRETEQRLLDTVVPRRRYHRKDERHIVSSGLDEFINSERGNLFFRPAILHKLISLGHSQPVFAIRSHGRHKPKIMPIVLMLDSNGKPCWLRIDWLVKVIKDVAYESGLSSIRRLFPKDAWQTICQEMKLNEIGIE